MWKGLVFALVLCSPVSGGFRVGKNALLTPKYRNNELEHDAYVTYEGQTPQKIMTGCEVLRFPNGEEDILYYFLDASQKKKYVSPGGTMKVAFPGALIIPGIFRVTTVHFSEFCFPVECKCSTCGFVVGPVLAIVQPPITVPTTTTTTTTAAPPTPAPCVAIVPTRPPLCPPKPPPTCPPPPAPTCPPPPPPTCPPPPPPTCPPPPPPTCPPPPPTCPPPPPPTCPPPPAPTCPPPLCYPPPPCTAMTRADTRITDPKYYSSLPGAVVVNTGTIYYPSCEKDAYIQPAIIPVCHDRHIRQKRDLNDEISSLTNTTSQDNSKPNPSRISPPTSKTLLEDDEDLAQSLDFTLRDDITDGLAMNTFEDIANTVDDDDVKESEQDGLNQDSLNNSTMQEEEDMLTI